MVSNQTGQAGHSLGGEVPDCMEHVCGVNPVVIWVRKEESLCLSTSMRRRCWPAYSPSSNTEQTGQLPLAAISTITAPQFLGQILN